MQNINKKEWNYYFEYRKIEFFLINYKIYNTRGNNKYSAVYPILKKNSKVEVANKYKKRKYFIYIIDFILLLSFKI